MNINFKSTTDIYIYIYIYIMSHIMCALKTRCIIISEYRDTVIIT